jgi:uncharacterized protein YndB with AHSA1/START domain
VFHAFADPQAKARWFGGPASASLTTVEIRPQGAGTHVTFTEQGVVLDRYDDAGSRDQGTRWLLDKLGASLAG